MEGFLELYKHPHGSAAGLHGPGTAPRLRAQLGAVSPGVPAAQAHRLHMDKTHWIVSRSCSAEMGTLGGLRGPRVFRRCSAWGRGASIEMCRAATEWGQCWAVTARCSL